MKKHEIYDSIIENLPIGFSMVDREGNITEFNRAAEQITGHLRNDVLGSSHLDILHGPQDIGSCPLFKRVLKKKKRTVSAETTIRTKKGDFLTVEVTSFPIYDEEGEFGGGVELFRDLSEQKQKDRERKNFLSMFIHDMKNAVIPVQGFLKRMKAGKAGPLTEKQQEYLELMKGEMDKFEAFVKDFLEFSKYEAKKYKPVLEDFQLGQALKKNIEAIKLEAEKKNLKIDFKPSKNIPVIAVDAIMINRVLMNLLNNAVKYTKAGETIHIHCLVKDGDVLVQVKNPGATIREKEVPFVFDAFYRRGKEKESTGLGLAISKKIIDMHHGKIWVDVTQGAETVFSFTLPVGQTT